MQENSTSQNDIYNNLINKDKYNKDKDYSLYETSYDEKPKDEIYNSEYYSKITLNEKNEDNEDNEEDKNTEEPAPSLFFSIEPEIKSNKICDCIEMDKLLLIRSSFFYKSKINKNDFYKVLLGKNMETNYQRIKQNKKKHDKNINNFHYNFVNLMEYAKEVITQLKNINVNKINFELELKFKNNKTNNQYFEKKDNNFYNFNISCKYKFSYQDKNGNFPIRKKYEHKNIFDEITQLTKISEIVKEIENLLNKISLNINQLNDEIKKDNNIKKLKKINKLNNSKLSIITFIKSIKKHNDSVQMIKELPCGYFVSCGFDGKIILYDENLNYLYDEKIIDNWIYSISEIPDTKDKFMVCCPEKIFLVSVKDNKLDLEDKRLNIKNSLNLYAFATREDEIILCGNSSITQYNGIIKNITVENKNNNIFVLDNIYSTCGKKITDNIISVVSNKVLNNGKDILKYINTNNRNELISEEYSFNINQNSLLIITTNIDIKNNAPEEKNKRKNKKNKKNKKINIQNNNSNEKAKLLFGACTKYYNDQKNGILILCPNGKKIQDNFYDTGDFEVFCFCLLNNNNNKNNNNYLFVGGYDNNLNQGLIKLYEIIYDDNNKIEFTKLKFIRNIFDLKIKEPINCIIQSSKTGEIIITSWDGTINLFSKPNLDF